MHVRDGIFEMISLTLLTFYYGSFPGRKLTAPKSRRTSFIGILPKTAESHSTLSLPQRHIYRSHPVWPFASKTFFQLRIIEPMGQLEGFLAVASCVRYSSPLHDDSFLGWTMIPVNTERLSELCLWHRHPTPLDIQSVRLQLALINS